MTKVGYKTLNSATNECFILAKNQLPHGTS